MGGPRSTVHISQIKNAKKVVIMFIDEINIKCIEINIINKKNRNVFRDKYLYFSERAEREDDAVNMARMLESLVNCKGYSNIDINIGIDKIEISCMYSNLYGKNGGYSRTVEGYLKLLKEIEINYNEYLMVIEEFN